ncbi:hypothetical protein OIDMADRAFT_144079 [Oidiodendron maius Zn]|uniref:NB-ARC domain-containing protein n=1 Tax=Oidiodendron maius (strain Zn) TaxID=913774 RepID=A0A0C3H3Y8_OIDMZ|nr:hypothetical protein OIDMADRAFT_144079 [Oidiodendron maius Zn]
MSSPGLSVIFDSAEQAASISNAPEIEYSPTLTSPELIVAVHGLNFKNSPDHARNTWTDGQKLWLKDFLPSRLSKPARIMLFAYNASPAMGAAAIKLDDHAKNLLHWLGIKRKALVEATLDQTYKSVVEATCLLVFFATPHQGGNYSTVGDAAAGIVRACMRNPSNDLVKSLKSSSDEATRRFEQFRHLNEKFLVISFYEGESYGKLGIIVDKKSATLNLAGTREKQVAMHADHSSICKFSAGDDLACELVMETIATEVERALQIQHASMQRRFVITGIGGQGKSEVCLKIADQIRETFWGVFWVDVSSESTAAAGFLRIADVLGSPVQNIDDARHLLSNLNHNWLLVLDNADNLATDYACYFPSGTRGTILLTSRMPECSDYNTVGFEQLESLGPADCVNLLLSAAKIPAEAWAEHELAAKSVVGILGSHTLALIQAGAYVARGLCSLGEYPTEYSRQCERLMKFSPKQAQGRYHNVYATFEVSAQVLESSSQKADRDALELLHLLAILHYNDVPLDLFEASWKGVKYARRRVEGDESINRLTKSHVLHLPQFIPVDLDRWNPFRLREALAQLQSLALLRKGKEGSSVTVSMHSLTHAWTNIRQNQALKRQSWRATGCILSLSYYGDTGWRPYRIHLNVHLQSFLNADSRENISSGTIWINQTLFQCGRLLHQLRMDSMLQKLVGELFSALVIDPVEPLEDLLPLYKLLSKNLISTGKTKEAIKVLERIGHLEERMLAEDHPDRLASQYELAGAYRANGQIKEAVQLLEHVVKIQERMLAEYHPDRLVSQHTLAGAYRANGQIRERTLAEDHPDQLASQHELAGAYRANGQVKEAIQLLEHVVKIQERTLAEDHPNRLASQHTLAVAYRANGQVKEAVQLLEHVVKIQERMLAEYHPDRLVSQYTLAGAYRANGQIKEAVQLLEHVVKIQERTLAEDHPSRLASQHALAIAYQECQKYCIGYLTPSETIAWRSPQGLNEDSAMQPVK